MSTNLLSPTSHLNIGAAFFASALVAAGLLLPPVASAQDADLARLWKDPVFQKQLLGSYGINSEIEPPATPEEMTDYDKIARLIAEDPREAERLLKLVIDRKKDASALFDFTLGNLYFQDGKSRDAAEAYVAALRKFPNFRRAHQNLAIIYIQNEYPDAAIRHFTKAIELGAANSSLFGLLGTAYIRSEEPVAAETAFRNALLMAPGVNDWKLGLARSLFLQKRYADVISLTDGMIKANPRNPALWKLQTSAYIGEKDLTNAAANYEILDELGELEPEELNTLGDIYTNNDMKELAAQAYLRAYRAQESPSNLEAPLRAAEILAARDGSSQASKLLSEVRRQAGNTLSDDQELRIMRLQANIAMARGNNDQAAEILERVVERDPLDGESLLSLGLHHSQRNSPEKAQFYYERAANLEEFTADANVRLAQLLVGQNKYREAIPLLQRAQELKPRTSVASFLDDLERYLKTRR